MKRVKATKANAIIKVLAIIVPLLLNINGLALATTQEAPAVSPVAAAAIEPHAAAEAPEEAHEAAAGGEEKAGDVIMHHILDNNVLAFEPFGEIELPKIVIGGFDISITKHVVMLWTVSAIVIGLFALAGGTFKNMTSRQAPKGLANALEALVQFIRDDVAKANIGKGYEKYLDFLLTAFFFILVCNLLGLVPYGSTATGNINVTLTLATFTFFITQAAALKAHGIKGYLAHLTGGTHPALWIIMIPIEFIGLFTKPVALTIRLFANMTAGHIVILSLIFISFILKSYIVAVVMSVPFSIFIYLLELFVAFLQAFIFTMLSALFIGLASAHEGHDEHEAGAAHH
ncbi:MAG: F0F1 ATP synthase subunit A [Chlorobiaceae bacterium]|nr:F0F1 ATP synthase subunit A [Chlorobiaceae bacterium]